MTNQQEFAFGLDPTTGASVNPITVPLNKNSHRFSYTRYAASNLTYTVWTSTDLQGWIKVLPADRIENVGPPNSAGVATVEVTLAKPPPGGQAVGTGAGGVRSARALPLASGIWSVVSFRWRATAGSAGQ